MTQIQHPPSETLTAYLESPGENKFNHLRLHLSNCKTCRAQVQQLQLIQQGIKRHLASIMTTTSSINNNQPIETVDNTLEQYIDSQLPEKENERVESLIRKDPKALKAALHYATHSRAMRRQMSQLDLHQAPNLSKQQINAKTTSKIRWQNILFNWNPSAWITVPLIATIVFAITFLLVPLSDNGQTAKFTIASYQDNPVIRYSDTNVTAPGIGFFSNAYQSVKPFTDINIGINEHDKLTFSWPAIDKASNYTVNLYVIVNGEKISLSPVNSDKAQVVFDAHNIQFNHRYEWKISGTTNNEKNFSTLGGFVVTFNK